MWFGHFASSIALVSIFSMFVTFVKTNTQKKLITFRLPLLCMVTKNGFDHHKISDQFFNFLVIELNNWIFLIATISNWIFSVHLIFLYKCPKNFSHSIKVAIDPTTKFFCHCPKHFGQCPVSYANLGDRKPKFCVTRLGDWKICVVDCGNQKCATKFFGHCPKNSCTNQNLLGNNQWPLLSGQLKFFWQFAFLGGWK